MTRDWNYYSTFIAVAEDCPARAGELPRPRGAAPTIAMIHHAMAIARPYAHTQEEILFAIELQRRGLDPAEHPRGGPRWRDYFASPVACMRTSPLGKRYGWGLHFNGDGRVAGFSVDSPEYRAFAADLRLTQTRALRASRAR